MRPSSSSALLSRAKLPALLISDPVHIRYITGLQASAGYVLALPRRYILLVDARYRDAADRLGGGYDVRDIGDLPKIFHKIPVCGFESESVTVERLRQWKRKFKSTKFVRSVDAVASFRRQKDEQELRCLRRARLLTKELLRRVPGTLKPGITEVQLANQLQIWALELGGDGLSFDPIVGFGTHSAVPHHHPTSRALQKGHIVQIDVGVRYKGYCGDLSEVYFTASPSAREQFVYKSVCRARDRAIKEVKAGVTNRHLDVLARDMLEKDGIADAFTHSLGHGVGLEVHEGVILSHKAPIQKLLPGEVITIEPGAYFPGEWGMRVEEMVFVK